MSKITVYTDTEIMLFESAHMTYVMDSIISIKEGDIYTHIPITTIKYFTVENQDVKDNGSESNKETGDSAGSLSG